MKEQIKELLSKENNKDLEEERKEKILEKFFETKNDIPLTGEVLNG